MSFIYDPTVLRFEPQALTPTVLARCAPSHLATEAGAAGLIRCMICRSTHGYPARLNAPRGFWVCQRCVDTRETCRRGPRRGRVKASEPELACAAYPADCDDPTRDRCACGMWIPRGQTARHMASEVHQYLLPIALSMKGRVLLCGQAATVAALAMSGADGKIGTEIHPAIARWFPTPSGIFQHTYSYPGCGVLAVTESVYDVIRRTIESVPVVCNSSWSITWASAFVMAYDLQNAYSKAPLAMWRWLMPVPKDIRNEAGLRGVQADLETHLGSAVMDRARNTVWARQIAAAHGEG